MPTARREAALLNRLFIGLGMRLLSILLLVPTTGAFVVAFVTRHRSAAKALALAFSLATLVAALTVWARLDFSVSGYQLVESYPWIPSLGVSCLIGIDGFSLFFVLMTAVLTVLWVLASWRTHGMTALFSVVLWLETAVMGALLAVDVLVFYFFWLMALVALTVLVGLAGGRRRRRAGLLFGVLTVGGGLLMLLVILVCHHIHTIQSGSPSFDTRHWVGLVLTPMVETWLFWGLFVAFAVQTPIFPFHVWLTAIAGEAPAPAHVLAATVVVKLGAYGLARFAVPWFPRAASTYAPAVMTLAAASLLISALAAVASADARKLLGRVTVAHMGVVLMGIFCFVVEGVKSAVLVAISHSFFMGGLIFMTQMVQERTGSPLIKGQRGLGSITGSGRAMALFLIAGGMAIPAYHGLAILRAAMERSPVQAGAAAAGLALLVLAFARLARSWLARAADREKKTLHGRELLVLAVSVVLVLWMGIAPGGLLTSLDSAARALVSRVGNHVVLTE